MATRLRVLLVASLAAHGVLVGGLVVTAPGPAVAPLVAARGITGSARAAFDAAAEPARILAARRELVAEARAARDARKLALGDFVLRANAIDARERGRALD